MALPPDVAKLTEVVRKKTMETLKEEGDRYVSPVVFVVLLFRDDHFLLLSSLGCL